MQLVPKSFFLTRGIGVHRERLTAFELALRDADIEQQNLVTISSIGDPPSDQSEWVCRSPRSAARTSSPPATSGPAVASRSARYAGTRPASTSSTTASVAFPIPGSWRSVPAAARSAISSGPAARTVAAAPRNALTL